MAALSKSKYWRQADAEAALDALAASDQSLTAFARQWGLNDGRLRRWQHRLGRSEPPVSTTALVPPFRRVEIFVDDAARPDSGVELVLAGGHRVVLQRGFDPQVLEDLLRALGAATC
jgi:hypothetical protein